MNVLHNAKGFSLVEALLVLAITSVIGVAVMQIMKDSTNTMALSEAKFDELELARQVQSSLVYKPSCEMNVQGKVVDNLTIADIQKLVDSRGNDLFVKGQKVGNQSLIIKDFGFTISQTAIDGFNAFKANPAGSTSYMLDVVFVLTTEKLKTTLGGKEMNRKIPIKIMVDASNVVKECFAANDAANYTAMATFCQQMGGTLNSTTNVCEFSQSCASLTGAQLIPAHCVDEKIAALNDAFTKALADLATRTPASVPAASPSPTPANDPYKLPFSYTNPGPGCIGDNCSASDFGPCNGFACTTNGGSCTGSACQTGVVTGTVAWDGKNMFTPSNPGPGCNGDNCHASDYGPCKGFACTTNGGSCEGSACQTGKN